ncbi:MAG: spermidine synthase [Gammaproteobacteria bacterium]
MHKSIPINRATLTLITVLTILSILPDTVFAGIPEEILFEAESPYQAIYVTRHDSLLSLRTGSRFSRSTAMDSENPYRHVFEYTGLMMMGLAYRNKPDSALVIGLGGGTVSKYLRKYYPELKIDNVEMDPVVADVAQRFFNFTQTPDNQVIVMDGRRFLQRSDRKYDLIFLDAYYGGYIPFHLLTAEFLKLVKSSLSDNGVVISNTWRSRKLYNRESATWASVFGYFDSFLGRRSANRVVIATSSGVRYSPEELIARMQATQSEMRFQEVDLPAMASSTLDLNPTWPADTPLLTDDFAPVNLLVDPRQDFSY